MQQLVARGNDAALLSLHGGMIVTRAGVEGGRVIVVDQDIVRRRRWLIAGMAEGLEPFQDVMERIQLLAHGQVREVRKSRHDAGLCRDVSNESIFAGALPALGEIAKALGTNAAGRT